MQVYSELKPFINYLSSFRRIKNYYSIDMLFPGKWVIPKSYVDETKIVAFKSTDPNLNGISFVSEINEKLDETFLMISDVIKYNIDREMKENLFKQKVSQLKQTFETTELDKLKNLHFKIEDENNFEDYDEIVDENKSDKILEKNDEGKTLEVVGE